MMGRNDDFSSDIDWGIYRKQQTQSSPTKSMQENNDYSRKDVPLGQRQDSVNYAETFLGKMPRNLSELKLGTSENNKLISDMIDAYAGTGGMKILGKGLSTVKPFISEGASKTAKYLTPGKSAEEFRSTLGSGTSSENIADLSKRAQFSKNVTKKEALLPKEKIYKQEGNTQIFPKNQSQISEYLADPEVIFPYSKKGKLIELHHQFENDPTLINYDALQSALKKKLREMQGISKTSETAIPKVEQLQANIANLDKDVGNFMKTLPPELQGLEKEFRNKYKNYAQTYEKGNKETGASLTLRRLAEGRNNLVTDDQVVKLFSNPTKADQKAILDMGTGAAKNAIYSALQRIKIGDAEGMAKTLLDLKRTKGFDKIITLDMEKWANNMLMQTKHLGMIKKSMSSLGAAGIGGMIGGIPGAMVGASLPWSRELGKTVASKIKKYI